MRVTRLQAEQNRQTVIDTASRLFRQHGFDGIGVKDLMQGAGLTQGGFYKQFASKEDLAAQAAQRALQSTLQRWKAAAARDPQDPLGAVVDFYLSPAHRSQRMEGCPLVALGSDAARQSGDIRASFEAGIREYLALLAGWLGGDAAAEGKAMAALSTMAGALLIARAVEDEALAGQILASAAANVLTMAADDAEARS